MRIGARAEPRASMRDAMRDMSNANTCTDILSRCRHTWIVVLTVTRAVQKGEAHVYMFVELSEDRTWDDGVRSETEHDATPHARPPAHTAPPPL
jgi:hypothetical protein